MHDQVRDLIRKNQTTFVVPEGVTVITKGAFCRGNGDDAIDGFLFRQIKTVVLPSTLKVIKRNAFSGINGVNYCGVETCVLPEALEVIGAGAFQDCWGLTDIGSCAKGLKSIGNYAFGGCVNLKALMLPSTIESVGRQILNSCYNCVFVRPMDHLTRAYHVESFNDNEYVKGNTHGLEIRWPYDALGGLPEGSRLIGFTRGDGSENDQYYLEVISNAQGLEFRWRLGCIEQLKNIGFTREDGSEVDMSYMRNYLEFKSSVKMLQVSRDLSFFSNRAIRVIPEPQLS